MSLETPIQIRTLQRKLYLKAKAEPAYRFYLLYDKIYQEDILTHAYELVKANQGAPGVDGQTFWGIETQGWEKWLAGIRDELRAKTYQPQPVRRVMIPKPGGGERPLGIPTIRDRVVQTAAKLVLEPIFEADFFPCSYGFRPERRAHDAIAETVMFVNNKYEWVVEGDITACFDEISHSALMGRVRQRIGDKRVLDLVKAFLKAGILGEDGMLRDSRTGAPQGGILSPLLSNVALSVLDEYIAGLPGGPSSNTVERAKRKRHGLANYRLIRYADDWLLLVAGTREHALGMRGRAAEVLAPMGLRLSEEKTKITHIDEGIDFLGWRIQRHRKKGTNRRYIYWYPSRKSVRSITGKIKMLCRRMDTNQPLDALLRQLNSALRGWCAYFRPGMSARTFCYLSAYLWGRVMAWLRRKHRRTNWKELRRRYCGGRWWPSGRELRMFNPAKVRTTRYLYRGVIGIPSPWPTTG